MRKLVISHLLLIMFLVGAASGFLVSSIGWWGLYQDARHLERVHNASGGNLQRVAAIQKSLLRYQALFIDALRRQQLSDADREALARIDADIDGEFRKLQAEKQGDSQWDTVVDLQARVAESRQQAVALMARDPNAAYRYHLTTTLPLYNQLFSALHRFIPEATQEARQTYEEASVINRKTRTVLVAMSVLASVFFCLTALLTYQQAQERRRKSAQLDEEHTLFRTLFEASNDGVILMKNGRVTDVNRAAMRLFALPAGQVPGTIDIDHLQPERQPDGTPSFEGLRARMKEGIGNGSQRGEWHFLAMDGREFPAELAIDVAHLHRKSIVQLTIRDIARRKEAEKALKLSSQAFENSLEGIAITDAKGNILTVNTTFTKITGYSREEVIGRNPSVLSSGRQNREFYQRMWREIGETGKWQGEVWNRRKNGDMYPQWLNISRAADEHGRVTNYVGVFSDITERKSAEERILHQVYYDQLTDLPNRVLFTDRLNQVMSIAKRNPGYHFAVMFIDLDRFKLINDSMGHDAGDQLLQQAAHRLRGSVRESDTVARMGGDEFTVVLSEIASPKDAANVAHKILDAFRQPFHLNGEDVFVSTSIGVAVYPEDGSSTKVLLKNADMAMYRAKGSGGSWFELHEKGLDLQENQRLSTETALHKSLERGEMELHYQPQYDCDSGKLAGFEALLRWRHPERGLLAPDAFLDIAEESGQIVPIGEWVLRTACAQAQAWRREFPGHRLMAVNLSARQFQSPDLVRQVADALRDSGLPHFCLELEIGESAVMQNLDASIAIMHALEELGVQFSIDDFGTGYSSLASLKRLPVHALKIDSSFIRDLDTDSDDAAIVNAIVTMSHKLGLRVVAKGIEEKRQLDALKAYKGIAGQGYLLGRPVTADAATRLIAETRPKLVLS